MFGSIFHLIILLVALIVLLSSLVVLLPSLIVLLSSLVVLLSLVVFLSSLVVALKLMLLISWLEGVCHVIFVDVHIFCVLLFEVDDFSTLRHKY